MLGKSLKLSMPGLFIPFRMGAIIGNYRLVNLDSIPEQLQELIIKQFVNPWRRKGVITTSQHGFVKNESHQTNLIFFDGVATLVADENVVNIINT